MQILLIDDDYLILESFSDFLSFNNFSVLTAQSLDEAEQLLREYSDIKLLILDINFPKSSGIEFLKRIRKDFPWLPVIIISANREEDVLDLLKDLGISAFIQKPFDPEMLLTKIHNVLGK